MIGRMTLVLALSGALAAPASSEAGWKAFKALKLYVADEVDADAGVFAGAGHFLVVPGTGGVAYLLTPKEYTVHRITSDAWGKSAESTVDPEKKASYESLGILEKQGATLKWTDGDRRYALSAKAPLIGEVSLKELRAYTDKYEGATEAYVPDVPALEALRRLEKPTEFVIGFGTWCPVCAEWLPRFIKSVEASGNDKLSMRFISINEDLDRPGELLETFAIEGVPTFIVRQNGKEVGRVTGEWLDEVANPNVERKLVEIASAGS